MKRLLFIEANRDGTVGGSHYSLLYLIQGLNKAKYELHVLFSQDNYLIDEFKRVTPFVYVYDVRFCAAGRARGLKDYIKWPYLFLNDIIFRQPLIGRLLRDIKPDLVHLNNGYDSCHEWMLGCFLRGIRIVCHDRGSRYPTDFRTKLFVRFSDAIISVSRSYMENVTRQRLKVPRAVCVHNGLDLRAFMARGGGNSSNELENELGLQTYCPRVGIVGNIQKWKGQMVFLKAINIISDEFPKLKCLIVGGVSSGEEEYQRDLEDYVKANGLEDKVIFTGFRRDIPEVIEIMDVLVHASIEPEPFSRMILEGMAAAKPIVATNSGGTPEQIVDGETGKLVPMNDPEKMAEGIRWMFLNPKEARKIGQAGRQRLMERFSIEQMVAGVERVYDEIFANGDVDLYIKGNN